MFQFTGFPPLELFIHSTVIEFYLNWVSPFGLSRFNWYLVYSTWIFADLHVLLRLLMPRHPPLALCSFTYLWISLSLILFWKLLMISYVLLLENFDNFYLSISLSLFSSFTLFYSMQLSMYYFLNLYSIIWISIVNIFSELLLSLLLKRWLKNIKNIPIVSNLHIS